MNFSNFLSMIPQFLLALLFINNVPNFPFLHSVTFHEPNGKSLSGFNMVHTISLYEVCSKRYLDLEVQPGRLKNEFQAICNLMDRYAYGDPHFHC